MAIHEREKDVERYYDRNTAWFLRFSRALQPHAIHQPLYEFPGMSTAEALHTPHRKILQYLPPSGKDVVVLDLGCGVGESLIYLANRSGGHIAYHGITLSGEQAAIAGKYAQDAGLAARICVYRGSYLAIPAGVPQTDLAFAIESFVHCTDSTLFFRQIAERLHPGGRLIIFDDFPVFDPNDSSGSRILTDLADGWLAHTLLPPDTVIKKAAAEGLLCISMENLTAMLRLNRVRDKLVRMAVPPARLLMHRSEFCRFVVGGDARQRAYQKGYLEYKMLVFEKNGA